MSLLSVDDPARRPHEPTIGSLLIAPAGSGAPRRKMCSSCSTTAEPSQVRCSRWCSTGRSIALLGLSRSVSSTPAGAVRGGAARHLKHSRSSCWGLSRSGLRARSVAFAFRFAVIPTARGASLLRAWAVLAVSDVVGHLELLVERGDVREEAGSVRR